MLILTFILERFFPSRLFFTPPTVEFGIEPTRHYWFPLAEFLQNQGIKVVVVNPDHVNKSKELEDNSQTKNDYKDAKVIADLVRNKVYTDLRILMNLRDKVIVNLGQVQRRIQNWLDCFFPKYLEVFKDWEGKASLITQAEFPTPQENTSIGAVDILKRWKKNVQRAVGIKRAEKLVEAALNSIGLTEGLMAARNRNEGIVGATRVVYPTAGEHHASGLRIA